MTGGLRGVSYIEPGAAYFDLRRLRRVSGFWPLWALGVGAAIWGHFSGWNVGYGVGGFGGMVIAGAAIAVMYGALAFSIAEMASALPHGGGYAFARIAMGPWGGLFTGLCQNVGCVVLPAVIAFFMGSYLTMIFETPPSWQPIWWIGAYGLFAGLNIAGAAISLRAALIGTLAALAVLITFWVSAVSNVDFGRWALNIAADGSELPYGNGPLLPFGWEGALKALPFAVWLFLAVDLMPLEAEESLEPARHVPRAMLLAVLTLAVSAFLLLWLNPAVIGVGAHKLASSGEPLLDGFRAIYGETHQKILAGVAIIGLGVSFQSILHAQGRQIHSMSRAGYFPPALSVIHPTGGTPHIAMLAGTAAGLGLIMTIFWTAGGEESAAAIGGPLLNMAVAAAMISYIAQAASFIFLRARRMDGARPYASPLGVPGAIVTIVIAAVTLSQQLVDPFYRQGVLAMLIWFVPGTFYFAIIGRHRLKPSPEEEFALAHSMSYPPSENRVRGGATGADSR